MNEYIDKNAAITMADYAVDEHPYEKREGRPETYSKYNQGWNDACDYIRDMLEDMPATDVIPVVHGKWIKVKWIECDDPDGGYWIVRCSQCDIPNNKDTRFCPHCGAKMDLED